MTMAPRVPASTYRLQLNADQGFDAVRGLVPYLEALGVGDLYLSPVLEARSGSSHGYDVTDPAGLNPELGTAGDFEALAREARGRGMGILLDIVPNHMAASPENPWWRDVLEHGAASAYAGFFDIAWLPAWTTLENRVLLPILGTPYGETLERGELRVGIDDEGLHVAYFETRLPLNPRTYAAVLGRRNPRLSELGGALRQLPPRSTPDPGLARERRTRAAELKQRLLELYHGDAGVRRTLDANIARVNGRVGEPGSFDLLDRILTDQAYWLAFWRTGAEEINYRRFFAITDLVGVQVHQPEVFDVTHREILRLVRAGHVTGLRIDHVDGLQDPGGYLNHLRGALSEDAASAATYVVVEKILGEGEALPPWPVEGTTGYDFATYLGGLFVHTRGFRALQRAYARLTRSRKPFHELVYEQKRAMLQNLFSGELRALERELVRLAKYDRHARDLPARHLGRALLEVTSSLPVYRTYVREPRLRDMDRRRIIAAVEEARRRSRGTNGAAFDFLRRLLLIDLPDDSGQARQEAFLNFVQRWQQLTGPATAKGVEDTALYRYNPLVSLNEVGSEPAAAAVNLEEFHAANLERCSRMPATMNATSTHDTKRSEDVRARIHVLSEIPRVWLSRLGRWRHWNRPHRLRVDGRTVPDPSAEVLIYQTLLGAWPFREEVVPDFVERLVAYLVKAAREAKTHTDWLEVNEAYEDALTEFARRILDPGEGNPFLDDFRRFQRRIAFHGMLNGLSHQLLKLLSPGVPDIYQGTELWDLSLVDPDNRRPVDFQQRAEFRAALDDRLARDGAAAVLEELLAGWEDGRIKLYLTQQALRLRQAHPALFRDGLYVPLEVAGRLRRNLCAFARRHEAGWAIAAAPIHTTRLARSGELPLGDVAWGTTAIELPDEAPATWTELLSGTTIQATERGDGRRLLAVAQVLQHAPVALLHAEPDAEPDAETDAETDAEFEA
jgi:(1->4)-alpha-D-glucan 1-alpha-D-glucosylmutase